MIDLSVAIDKISPFLLIKTLFSAGFHFSGTLIHLVPSVTSKFYFIFFPLCVHSLNVVCLRFGPLSYPPQWISCRPRILGYNFQISRLDVSWVPDSCFQLEWSRHLKFNIVLSIVVLWFEYITSDENLVFWSPIVAEEKPVLAAGRNVGCPTFFHLCLP